MIAMQIDEYHIPPVMECIIATERHEMTASQIVDLPLFLDMDLAILGTRENVYKEYSEVIRAEYSWVPMSEYRIARGKFLKRFLERPSLFFTPEISTALEHQARLNLESELRELAFAN